MKVSPLLSRANSSPIHSSNAPTPSPRGHAPSPGVGGLAGTSLETAGLLLQCRALRCGVRRGRVLMGCESGGWRVCWDGHITDHSPTHRRLRKRRWVGRLLMRWAGRQEGGRHSGGARGRGGAGGGAFAAPPSLIPPLPPPPPPQVELPFPQAAIHAMELPETESDDGGYNQPNWFKIRVMVTTLKSSQVSRPMRATAPRER